MTVQANLGSSLNIAGSRTPRGTTPIPKIQGVSLTPRLQPFNIVTTNGPRRSGIRTLLKRVGPIPILGPSTQDAPRPHGAGNIANQNSESPAEGVPTHNNAPFASATGIQKSGKSSVASSSVRKVRSQKINAPKKP